MMVFAFSIAGYATSSDLSNETTVKPILGKVEKLSDPSQLVRTPDPNRIYYTIEPTTDHELQNGNLVCRVTGRYIWSVDALNPTVATLALDNVIYVSSQILVSTVNGVSVEEKIGERNQYYISGSVNCTFAGVHGYTAIQNFIGYPDGSYRVTPLLSEWGAVMK